MTTTSQITQAETFGTIAYEQDTIRAASQSKELMEMLEGYEIGKTPEGKASSKELMDAWYKGWDIAHRKFMKAKFGF